MADSPLPLSLFGSGTASVTGKPTFRRVQLDPCCWVDYVDGFVEGADSLFARVQADFDWFRGERLMYGRWLDEPRLTAKLDLSDTAVPWVVKLAVRTLTNHYDRTFAGLFCNYYQNGQDSVAWHADRIGRSEIDPLVAIVSLGGPRTLALRPQQGGPGLRVALHSGDLLVMGGATQHHWEHAVPKVARAAPRMSVTLRAGGAPLPDHTSGFDLAIDRGEPDLVPGPIHAVSPTNGIDLGPDQNRERDEL